MRPDARSALVDSFVGVDYAETTAALTVMEALVPDALIAARTLQASAYYDEEDLSVADIMLEALERAVGSWSALMNLDTSPLSDEPFEWAGIPEDVHDRVREVLELCDQCADELFDTEHRTAFRRFLGRAAAADPAIFRRKGRRTGPQPRSAGQSAGPTGRWDRPAESSRVSSCGRTEPGENCRWHKGPSSRIHSRNEPAVPHDLATFRNGNVSFYSARQPAWHRLGTVTPKALNAKDALKAAHLDGWDIRKMPLTSLDHDGKPVTVHGKFATVRRNPDPDGDPFDALGVVGEDYEVVQNEDAFAFLTGLVDDGEATFETAGALKGGSRVFVTMRLPEQVRIAGDDRLDLFVAVATGHDGEFAFHAFPTPVRIVCQNTLSLALSGARNRYVVRHDKGAAPKLAEARSILKVTFQDGDLIGKAAQEMLKQEVTEREFDRLVTERLLPLPPNPKPGHIRAQRRKLDDLRRLAWYAPTQEVGRGTAWGAFNALSEWSEWVAPRTPGSAGSSESVLIGKAAGFRQQAWDLLAPSWASRSRLSQQRR